MTPEDIKARIQRLATQYPDLVDVINLPNPTQGYRRTAVVDLGPVNDAVIVESVKFGDEGMNGVQVRSIDPGAREPAAAGHVPERPAHLSLATDASGAITSTTDDVAAFISATYRDIFRAYVASGSAGKTMPVAGPAALSDWLKAGANVPRAPWTVQALRIGVHRDGSRIGVLAYSQEHAREWAVPLVTLEFARAPARELPDRFRGPQAAEEHRDLRDPDRQPGRRQLFVQRLQLPAQVHERLVHRRTARSRQPQPVGRRRQPQLQRRLTVRRLRGCEHELPVRGRGGHRRAFRGREPQRLHARRGTSEHQVRYERAQLRRVLFMWPPGAYQAAGRITLPRPSIAESKQFLDAAQQIVGAIASERRTVTWPAQTGPVCDVLYSAAGNSAEELYYNDRIFAWDFEVGNDLWNAQTQQWDGVGFQPPFAEGHAEAMEYATGLVELLRVADQYATDTGWSPPAG
jgi:hypothetical protein